MKVSISKITSIALLAALSYISFTFLQVKIPTPGGTTSFHLGNTFAVLGALLIGGVPGGIAASIGMGIGDILDPVYIMVAPKTILLKFMIGVVTGLFAHKIFKITMKDKDHLFVPVLISAVAGMVFNVIGEPIFSYFYTTFVLGTPDKAALALASWNAVTTTVNAVLSVICGTTIYMAMYPTLKKTGLLDKLLK